MRRKASRILSGLVALPVLAIVTACAAQPAAQSTGQREPMPPSPTATPVRAVVPDVATLTVAEVDKRFAAAGLIPILRYQPGVVTEQGTAVGTDPPAGTSLTAGQTVTVLVAGEPAETLDEYVNAHRESFVGMAADSNGVIVIGIYQQADLQREIEALGRLAKGAAYRVQTCAHSFTELQRVQLELARRDFLPGADRLSFAMAIDPLACAVRLTIDLSDADIAKLTAKYSGTLVIQKGTAWRAG